MSQPEFEIESLPLLYQRWVEALFPEGIPRERTATCLDCAMCGDEAACHDAAHAHFDPSLKCCTYFPALPNYLVGRAMDAESAGAAMLRAFIAARDPNRAEVTLLGVAPNYKFRTLYHAESPRFFGHDRDLLCPYAINADGPEGPLCGIWQHRNSVCSTYFCKHVRGETGRQFWLSLRNLLKGVESSLSWWCVTELIPEIEDAIHCSERPQENGFGMTLADNAWRYWPGTAAEFYRACAERVEALEWAEVRAIAGIQTALQTRSAQRNHRQQIAPEVPARLKVTAYRVIQSGNDRTMLQGDPPGEDFEVPSLLVSLLAYFDGRPTEEILQAIYDDHQVEIDGGLLVRLCDFGALAPAGA